MPRLLVYVVPVALAVYALIDLWRSEVRERAGLHPALWVAVIVLLPVVGPIAWIIISRTRRAGAPRTTGGPPSRPGRPARKAPLPPDDDPDFLWRLEQERRRRLRREGGSSPEEPSAEGPPREDDA